MSHENFVETQVCFASLETANSAEYFRNTKKKESLWMRHVIPNWPIDTKNAITCQLAYSNQGDLT
jgi:hypothetical protein